MLREQTSLLKTLDACNLRVNDSIFKRETIVNHPKIDIIFIVWLETHTNFLNKMPVLIEDKMLGKADKRKINLVNLVN